MKVIEEIVVKDLWWRYKDRRKWTLKGINLEVKKGESVGITGPSGAGKTTLCMAICGLIPHEIPGEMKGTVKVSGTGTESMELRDIVRNVGILFQDPETQFVSMSVLDEVAFGLENFGYSSDEVWRRIEWALKTVGMEGYEEKHPLELSGGEKQRVALASILALEPRILVLDEPTSNLDAVGRENVFSAISALKERSGTTMIIVEHDTEELVKLVDRVILLYSGELIAERAPEEFFREVDFLKERGVRAPQVTALCYKLSQTCLLRCKLPITSDMAQRIIRDILNDRKISPSCLLSEKPVARDTLDVRPVIAVKNLWYTYPDGTEALRGIDLIIHEGEYIAFLGRNGSGKTTLAKHFIGLLKPFNGQVVVDGIDVRRASVKELASKVGYVFQNPDHQLFCESIEEEVGYGPKNLGLSKSEVKKRVEKALETVDMFQYRKEHPFSFGKAERQRIAVASVLAMEPRIIVVDEPTTGQDMGLSKAMMNLLNSLNEKGKTIIVITHNMRLVAEHAKRVVILHEGELLLDAPTRRAFAQSELLRKAHLRPPQITQLAQALRDIGFPSDVLTVDEMYNLMRAALSS